VVIWDIMGVLSLRKVPLISETCEEGACLRGSFFFIERHSGLNLDGMYLKGSSWSGIKFRRWAAVMATAPIAA
jgi:hypothetical protein